MPEYLQPGVYVEEVAGGARPISGVSTSTAAFFGIADGHQAPEREPVFVTSFSEFRRLFCDGLEKTAEREATPSPFATAVSGFFLNGGSRLYIVNLGSDADTVTSDDLDLIAGIDGISLIAAPGFSDAQSVEAIMSDCEAKRGRFAVLDTSDEWQSISDLTKVLADGGLRPRNSDRGIAATYLPWLNVRDALSGESVIVAPSGHICGLYARIDVERGVFKAPANSQLRGVIGLTHRLSDADQAILNPSGINLIRVFREGIKVWGARTLADPASDWRYVPVRRLVLFLAESIERGTQWVVFEPNDERLWKALRRDIGAFLHTMWREGALAGSRVEHAYYVKCDRETTTDDDINDGRVIVEIGIAPVKPAEFVIIRIGQTAGQSTVEEA